MKTDHKIHQNLQTIFDYVIELGPLCTPLHLDPAHFQPASGVTSQKPHGTGV